MYQANTPRVVHETIEGETVIIDTVSGLYYTAAGNSSVIWEAIAAGANVDDIKATYASCGRDAGEVQSFLDQLIEAGLLAPRSEIAVPAQISMIDATLPAPALTIHDDLQGLIELDPIHEIDAAQGWPFRSPGEQ